MAKLKGLVEERINKLKNLRAAGIDPYGGRYERSQTIKEAITHFEEGRKVSLCGRIMALRSHGKAKFLDLMGKVQVYIKKDVVGEERFDLFTNIDIGDFIGVKGTLFMTRTHEPTVKVEEFTILAKSLRPLPEKWHGLKDVETRYRQRCIDLIANKKVKEIFLTRTKIIGEIRRFLDDHGYAEVETPIMQPIPGGATGRPFRTHHNVFDIDLYLRIAPELYLKRLIVGGFERIYEINKSFRNEGISTRHNPEFTMLEVYQAYADYTDMMRLTQELITSVAREALGKLKFEFKGKVIDLSRWDHRSFAEMMKDAYGITPDEEIEGWVEKLRKKGVKLEGPTISRSQVINIIGELLEPEVTRHPVFVTDLFAELCPLAKRKPDNELLTERFELFIGGLEIANAYSELNDPIEQRERFKMQARELRSQGELEPQEIDEDFVRALEYGMPPAGGLGIGIDRLVMVLTNSDSIRDVILFPQLKPEGQGEVRQKGSDPSPMLSNRRV